MTSALWYVLGFAFAGFTFVFMTIGMSVAASAIGTRATGTRACPTSRASTRSATPGAASASRFYIYALLFVAFDIEVIFICCGPWCSGDLLLGGFISMLLFVGILLVGLGYAWRKGVLTWK